MKKRRKKPLKKFIALFLLLVVGGILGANFLLERFLEGELKKRTRLEWSMASATWSPWGGIRLREVVAELPSQLEEKIAPVVRVQRVEVYPYWSTVFQKRPEFREVVVEKPEGNIPIELISLLLAEKGQSKQAEPILPTLPKPKDPVVPVEPNKKDEKKPNDKVSEKPKPQKVEQQGSPAVEEKVEKSLPSRIIVRNGRCRFYSMAAGQTDLLIEGFTLDLPISGPEAEGVVTSKSVSFSGQQVLGTISHVARWKEPYLDFPAQETEWQGLKFLYGGRLQLKGGTRYSVALQGQPGKMQDFELSEWTGGRVGIEQVKTFLVRSDGDLRRPGTWRADVLADVRGVNLVQKDRNLGHRFDLGQFVAVFRQGSLQIADMRLRSERLSLLGNGIVRADGHLWSVLRVVADPEISEMMTRVAVGSHLSRGWMSKWMRPMGTPDRYYRDLHFQGRLPQVFVDVGKKGEFLELREIAQLLRSFVRGEAKEEAMSGKENPSR